MKKVILGITGASGIPIAFTLLKNLLLHDCKVCLVFSKAGMITVSQEVDISLSSNPKQTKEVLVKSLTLENPDNLFVYSNEDWYAPMASGSSIMDAMVVCPCSMATLAKVASGISDDLIARSCDVILKERRNLILVPREMPFSAVHLENMHKLANLGVSIIPPVPAFYTHPKTVDDIIDFIVSRILDQLQVPNDLINRWGK